MLDATGKEIILPAIRRIQGQEGLFLVYGRNEDGSYEVARHVRNEYWLKVHNLHPGPHNLQSVPKEEFRAFQSALPTGDRPGETKICLADVIEQIPIPATEILRAG